MDWYDTVPDKIHNRYYYNTYDFLMDSRRTRERLPEYVEFMRKMPLYKKLRIDGECWLLAHACTEEVLSFWKRKERMLWSTEMIDRGKGFPDIIRWSVMYRLLRFVEIRIDRQRSGTVRMDG